MDGSLSASAQTMNEVRYIEVQPEEAGQRIDNFLFKKLKGVPKSLIYRLLRRGEIRVNKGRVKAHRRLIAADRIRIPPLRTPEQSHIPIRSQQLKRLDGLILYEDEGLMVINKPAGLAVHGGSGLSFGVIELLRQSRPQAKYLELVHRLDRETSGCLLIAKKRSVLKALHRLQQQHRIQKQYLALLAGRWSQTKQRVQAPLQKNQLRGGERMVRVHPQGQRAETLFQLQQAYERCSLVRAQLKTGRTHQIRVHAQYLGSPILGDQKYASPLSLELSHQLGIKRLFLHAQNLQFWLNDRHYNFQAPLPPELKRVLERL